MTQIVIIDGKSLALPQSAWERFHQFGSVKFYEATLPTEVVQRCSEANLIIVNKVVFDRQTMDQLPKLQYIGVSATGYNNIDLAAAKGRGIVVTNVPSYATRSVAQHAFALLLEAVNHVGIHNAAVHEGEWARAKDFYFAKKFPIDLEGLTFGVVGYGAIGQAAADLASAFGMKVIACTRNRLKRASVPLVDLETLLRTADVVSLHCALTPETKHLINASSLKLMKPTAILLNTSRGPLIDESALATALKEKRIYAAALDVLEKEPPLPTCPLFELENCIVTPHLAWSSPGSRQKLLEQTIENVDAFLNGNPINLIEV